ncbi:hypothetical protein [Treponema sp.]|uniref:hypothetical protein n=1 Tax=Treponema sp. TaxID=166 RepID=UPI0025EB711B|nr:hypothetical protein [Treponema sp.]MBR4321800.1 hypothetical protein [Treponema sp.]
MTENAKLANLDLDLRQIMLAQERSMREMQELKEGLNKVLSSVITHADIPEWVDLKQACQLKRLNSFNTVKQHFWLKPGCGQKKFQRICDGRIVYNRDEVIIPWLSVTSENLLSYLENCGLDKSCLPEKLRKELEAAAKRLDSPVPMEV